MAKVRQIFGSSSLFSQVALFSVAGLSMSLMLVFNYNVQIGTPWL